MGDAQVDHNQLEQIEHYVKSNIGQWLKDQHIIPFPERDKGLDRELLDRMITVEQQLKFQNEKIEMMLDQSAKNFESMDKRFEAVDKRFEAVNKRFEDMRHSMDKGFESMDKRFEDMLSSMDKRFEAVDKRFTDMQYNMDKRFNVMTGFMALGFTLITVLMSVYKFISV